MSKDSSGKNVFDAAKIASDALSQLTEADKSLAIEMIARKLGITQSGPHSRIPETSSQLPGITPTGGGSLTPRDFMVEKKCSTDQDKVTCLAYFLRKYRKQLEFKPKDITALNTEAGEKKLSNVPQAVGNASRPGLLVTASRGHWQISAAGERYVEALPDKEAAKAVLKELKPRKSKAKRVKSKRTTTRKSKSHAN